jgi:hypothetical protein
VRPALVGTPSDRLDLSALTQLLNATRQHSACLQMVFFDWIAEFNAKTFAGEFLRCCESLGSVFDGD